MFKNTLHRLKNLKSVSFSLEADKDGYIDRECPSQECLFRFKVFKEDWLGLDEVQPAFCPLCRHEDHYTSWHTTEQIEQAREQAIRYVKSELNGGLRQDARRFNTAHSNDGFLRMSIQIKGGITHFLKVPIAAMEEMTLKIQCENCQGRFAVVGSAFFCPCCGHNSVERTLDDSLVKVESKLSILQLLRESLAQDGRKDEAETTCRSLIETSLSDCVVAFQRYCDEVYKRQPGAEQAKPNTFQRLDDGSAYWKRLTGEGYEDWLDVHELARMNLLFQRRHLLAHTEGIVDDRYLAKSRDMTYKKDQRIVVNEKDARDLLHLVRKVVAEIRTKTT